MTAMTHTDWIFLSPHFDDAALSCGGLIWELARAGARVQIWTIMGGFPPEEPFSDFARATHAQWGTSGREAISMRREEDRASCEVLQAAHRHFDWPDGIYRRQPESRQPVVSTNEALFSSQPEARLVEEIAASLSQALPPHAGVAAPLGLGGHIDHQAVFQAVRRRNLAEFFYADYPYILTAYDDPLLRQGSYKKIPHPLSREAVEAWQRAVLRYASQLSGLWSGVSEARLALKNYQAGGGGRLWRNTADEMTK